MLAKQLINQYFESIAKETPQAWQNCTSALQQSKRLWRLAG